MEEPGKTGKGGSASSLTLWKVEDEPSGQKITTPRRVPPLKPGDIWPVFAAPEPCAMCSGELMLRVERSYARESDKDRWKYTAKGCCMTCGDSVTRDLPDMTEPVFEGPYWEGVFHVYVLDELWTGGDRALRENCVRLYLAHELKATGEGPAFQAELKHLVPRDVWPEVSDFFRRVERRWVVQDPVGAADVMTRQGRWRFRVEGRAPQEELAIILAARRQARETPNNRENDARGEQSAAA